MVPALGQRADQIECKCHVLVGQRLEQCAYLLFEFHSAPAMRSSFLESLEKPCERHVQCPAYELQGVDAGQAMPTLDIRDRFYGLADGLGQLPLRESNPSAGRPDLESDMLPDVDHGMQLRSGRRLSP